MDKKILFKQLGYEIKGPVAAWLNTALLGTNHEQPNIKLTNFE